MMQQMGLCPAFLFLSLAQSSASNQNVIEAAHTCYCNRSTSPSPFPFYIVILQRIAWTTKTLWLAPSGEISMSNMSRDLQYWPKDDTLANHYKPSLLITKPWEHLRTAPDLAIHLGSLPVTGHKQIELDLAISEKA